MANILIADDSEEVRRTLKRLLSSHEDWVVCGEAANGHEAVDMANQLKPDLVVLDLAMPILDGLHAAAQLLKTMPSLPIVIYTLYDDDERIELEAKKAGVRRVISKSANINVILQCLEELLSDASEPLPPDACLSTDTATGK
jgi:DNA-binding NarL/FixJ family response regulator